MTLEALASTALPAFVVYDTISASFLQQAELPSSAHCSFLSNSEYSALDSVAVAGSLLLDDSSSKPGGSGGGAPVGGDQPQVRRKRRRRQKSCKNKEEAESQRMTHIAVERNRRRLMNEHLSVLRSLMPESYIQRGDQASIVGGAIDFVKELEQQLQSLEVQKRKLQQQKKAKCEGGLSDATDSTTSGHKSNESEQPPFAQFFAYPQYIWCHSPPEYPHSTQDSPCSAVADIEVSLIETHANLRVLTPRRPRQLLKMVAGLQSLRLSILHLNVTTLDSMVLYSISAKVEEGCSLTTVDDIAAAVHHMLILFQAEIEMASCSDV